MSARLPDRSIAADDLALLAGGDEPKARDAFDRLWEAVRRPIGRQIARSRRPDGEDVAQEVATRLWRFRGTLRARTFAEWYALVRVTTSRRLAEVPLGAGEVPLDEEAQALFSSVPSPDAWVAAAQERGRVREEADRLWLGEPTDEAASAIGAAAIVSVLVDGVPVREAEAMFALAPGDFERHLADGATLARALYAALCWPNGRLAGHVLRPDRPLSDDELDHVAQCSPGAAPEGWTPDEARAACLRLRNGLTEDELGRAAEGALDRVALDSLLERVRAGIPFRAIARDLRSTLPACGAAGVLGGDGLWKRITLEYAMRDLPQRQIVERAAPAAREGGFVLDEGKVSNWLSRGRILQQLAQRLGEEDR